MSYITTIYLDVPSKNVVEASTRFTVLDSLIGRFNIVTTRVPNDLIKKYKQTYSGYRKPECIVRTDYKDIPILRIQLCIYLDGDKSRVLKGALGYIRYIGEPSNSEESLVEIMIDTEYQGDHSSLRKRKISDGVWYHRTDSINGYRDISRPDDLLCRAAAMRDRSIMGAYEYHNFMPMDNLTLIYRLYRFIERLQVHMLMTGTDIIEIEGGSRYMPRAMPGVIDWDTFWFNKVIKIPGNGGGTGYTRNGYKTASMHTHYRISGEVPEIHGNAYCEVNDQKNGRVYLTFLSILRDKNLPEIGEISQVKSMFYKIFPTLVFPRVNRSLSNRSQSIGSLDISGLGPIVNTLGVTKLAAYLTDIDHIIHSFYVQIGKYLPKVSPDICSYDVKPISEHTHGTYYNFIIQTSLNKKTYRYGIVRVADYLTYYKLQMTGPEDLITVDGINMQGILDRDDFLQMTKVLALQLHAIYVKIIDMYNCALVYQQMTHDVDYDETDVTYSL